MPPPGSNQRCRDCTGACTHDKVTDEARAHHAPMIFNAQVTHLCDFCQDVNRLKIACSKLGDLLTTSMEPVTQPVRSGLVFRMRAGSTPRAEQGPPPAVDVACCHVTYLRPSVKMTWTVPHSQAYQALQKQEAAQRGSPGAGLVVVVVSDTVSIEAEALNEAFRDAGYQDPATPGLVQRLPRILPVNCATIFSLDLGREAQVQRPVILAAEAVNRILEPELAADTLPPAALRKHVLTTDKILLWVMMHARIGRVLELRGEFWNIVPS